MYGDECRTNWVRDSRHQTISNRQSTGSNDTGRKGDERQDGGKVLHDDLLKGRQASRRKWVKERK
jgi:hypothetical protein